MAVSSGFASPSRVLVMLGGALIAVLAIGWLDIATGPEFGLSLFYAVPVFLAADRIGLRYGSIVAVASTLVWTAAQVVSSSPSPRMALLLWNVAVRAVLFAVLVALSAMKRKFAYERRMSSTDALTGIPNRRMLDGVVVRELARVRRTGCPITMAYFDCDNFKGINDRFGHATGNEVLRIVARILVTGIREIDLAARIGGDEFVVMLIEADSDHARDILDRIQIALVAAMNEHSWPVTFSIGATTTSVPPRTTEELVAQADRLMYRAKTNGKNLIVHEVVGRTDVAAK